MIIVIVIEIIDMSIYLFIKLYVSTILLTSLAYDSVHACMCTRKIYM